MYFINFDWIELCSVGLRMRIKKKKKSFIFEKENK